MIGESLYRGPVLIVRFAPVCPQASKRLPETQLSNALNGSHDARRHLQSKQFDGALTRSVVRRFLWP